MDNRCKQAALLTFGGTELQDNFYMLPNHDSEVDKKMWYAHIIELLDAYFVPKSNITYKRLFMKTTKYGNIQMKTLFCANRF